MKRIISMFMFILFTGIAGAQVQNAATVEWIGIPDYPGADPLLCVFGNTLEDASMLIHSVSRHSDVTMLVQKEETNIAQILAQEMNRLKVKYLCILTIQREMAEKNGEFSIVEYYLINIVEKSGNTYYIVASNVNT